MSGPRRFANVETIKKAITHLYAHFGSAQINSYQSDFDALAENSRYGGDLIVSTQKLAADIASHYRIPITTVIVNYSATLSSPGRVELSRGNEFFVELHANYRRKINAVAGILSHEIAHVFLHRFGASCKYQITNEILTDTTAAYLGFGVTIMNASVYRSKNAGKSTETTLEYFGYLSPDEFGYLLARRDDAFNLNSRGKIGRPQWRKAYDNGLRKMRREQNKRPFLPRPWYEIFFTQLIKRKVSAADKVKLECLKCSKNLRVPANNKKIVVNCPNCGTRFFCYP
jgi:hypothetical protein